MNPNDMMLGQPLPRQPLLTILNSLKTSLIGTIYEQAYGVELFFLHAVAYLALSQDKLNEGSPNGSIENPFQTYFGGTLDAIQDSGSATLNISVPLPFPQPPEVEVVPSLLPKIVYISSSNVFTNEEFAVYGVNFTGVTTVQILGVAICVLTRPQDNTDTVLYVSCPSAGSGQLRVITPNGQHLFGDYDVTVNEPSQP